MLLIVVPVDVVLDAPLCAGVETRVFSFSEPAKME